MSPITVGDFLELANHLQEKHVLRAKRLIQVAELSPDVAVKLIEKAIDEAKNIELGRKAFDEASGTPDATKYILWLSLRKKHPELSLEEITPIFDENMEEIVGKVAKVAGRVDDGSDFPKPPTAGAGAEQTNP
jgi:hypothetical protein